MKKIIFTLLIIHCSLTIANAQWYSVENGSSGYIMEVKFKDESTGWYISDNLLIYRTTNGGFNWKCIDIPYVDTLRNIHNLINSGDTLWLLANGSRIIKSTNSGFNWIIINYSLNETIFSLSYVRQNLIYGLTENPITHQNYLVKSTDGGLNWNSIFNFQGYQTSNYLNFVNDSTGYLMGHNWIYKTTNSGYNWFIVYIDTGSIHNVQFDYMKFINNDIGFLLKNLHVIYRTSDGGITWDSIMIGRLRDVEFDDNANGYAIIEHGLNYFYKTTNSGINWILKFTYLSSMKPRTFMDLEKKGNTIYIASFGGGGVFKSTNNGEKWIDLAIYNTITDFHTISFINSQTGFIGGDNMVLMKTTDSGENWFIDNTFGYITNLTFKGIKLIQFINESLGWFLADTGFYKTTNSGMNWYYFPTNFTYPTKFYFINSNTGWVAIDTSDLNETRGAIFKTTNGGINFIFQGFITASAKEIRFYDSLYGYVVCSNIIQCPNLWRTTDGGNTWQGFDIGLGFFSSVYIIDKKTAFIGADMNSGIYKTIDGGNNWSIVCDYNTTWNSIEFANAKTGFAINYDKSIYCTTNSGDNWFYRNIGAPTFLGDLYFNSQGMGFAVGHRGKIYKTTNFGGIVGINFPIITVPKKSELFQNYPNPFNTSTNIIYHITYSSYITLKVYNVVGKEVATLVSGNLKPGQYKISFDASKLASGIYFYSFCADGVRIDTKKMLLTK